MKIGVFDSGVGGQSMANAILRAIPELEILVREDRENLPYGSKTPEQLLELVTPILQEMVDAGCKAIVIACNTVTTTIIQELRKHFSIPLVAVEPMVKPAAAQTKSAIIAICATPTTLTSKRYAELKQEYADGITVLEPDCSDWAYMIEHTSVDNEKIARRINEVLAAGADVIVLACTHYHWIEEDIKKLAADKAIVLQPEAAIIRQLKRVLEQLA
jgi:glutamate racemase